MGTYEEGLIERVYSCIPLSPIIPPAWLPPPCHFVTARPHPVWQYRPPPPRTWR